MIKYYKSFYRILYQDLNIKPIIPTSDEMAIELNTDYKKFYNKMYLSKIQGLKHGLNVPDEFPVVVKPYQSLKGGSIGFKIVKNKKEFKLKKGDFWMEILSGEHLCIDIFILNGEIKLYTILRSKAAQKGTFEYHESMPNYKLSDEIKQFINKNFSKYTGIINCETISNKIIDLHLRPNGDFFLYNMDVVKQIINLYMNHKWELVNYKVPKMFLFPIFIKHNKIFDLDINKTIEILERNNCNNLLINHTLESPGGNRILMYSSPTYEEGNKAKIEIFKKIKFYKKSKKIKLILFLFIVLFLIFINGGSN
jgi:hypothetical protein